MIEDMLVRNFSPNTQRSYVHYVAEFARHYKTGPEHLSLEHVRAYQVYLAEQRQLSPASINTFVSAAQFLYTVTLEMPWGASRFVRMKVPETLPVVLSREEIERLFRHVGFLTHRAVLMLCYGSGLRISEAVSLRAGHIDSERMLIRVEKGKGAKDRYTVLSTQMLHLLRRYWKAQRPAPPITFSLESSPALTSPPAPFSRCVVKPVAWPESKSMSRPILCATASPRICWRTEPTRAPFRFCSATAALTPPRATPPSLPVCFPLSPVRWM
jgi:integrase